MHRRHFHFEDERRVRRDGPAADTAIGERRRNDQTANAARLNADQPLVPACDHLPGAEHERERRSTDVRFELQPLLIRLRSVVQPSGVLNGERASGRGRRTRPDPQIGLRERRGRRERRVVTRSDRRCSDQYGSNKKDAQQSCGDHRAIIASQKQQVTIRGLSQGAAAMRRRNRCARSR